jgi:hypothetical protein
MRISEYETFEEPRRVFVLIELWGGVRKGTMREVIEVVSVEKLERSGLNRLLLTLPLLPFITEELLTKGRG